MKALHWDGATLELREQPAPEPGPEEALVRVRLAGVCSTDLEILRGYMGFEGIPGHEFVGEVLQGPPEWVGARVVGEINFACGACPECRRGLARHCPTRQVLGILGAPGCFAEELVIPTANLHRVPEEVSDEAAVFAEPLAAAFEILEQVHLDPSAEAWVFGDGRLGQLIARVLHQAGARTTLIGKHADKLALAEAAGISCCLLDDLPERRVELAVEASGSATGLAQAIRSVRPRGTLVLKSTVAAEHQLSLAALVIDEIRVIGSRCGPFEPALRALAAGRIDPTPLIVKTYPLEEGLAALEHAGTRGVLKVLLKP